MKFRALVSIAAAGFAFAGCAAHYSDDDFVTAANALRPSVVLLSMQVPGDSKKDGPDDEYATGTVVASGAWGSDILTVQHAIDEAWNLRVTVDNKQKVRGSVVAQDKDLDIALVRTPRRNLPVVKLGKGSDAQPGRMV